jgi:hypothetical protein
MRMQDFKLALPTFKIKDWEDAVAAASGVMKDILSAQTEGVRLLVPINETEASTERIGWLNLWAKTFAALEAVAAAQTHRSKLVIQLAQRTSFELMLQAHAIIDPLRKLNEKQDLGIEADPDTGKNRKPPDLRTPARDAKEFAFRSCVDRLRAYTAWCLWHDKAYFKEVLNPKSMRDIWSSETGIGLKNIPHLLSPFLESEGDHCLDENCLREGSRNVRKLYTEKIRQIEEWLADPQLRPWEAAIEGVSRKNIVGVPFFALFDRSDVSIPKRLLREGIRFTYSTYIASSMASHASAMEEFIQMDGGALKPLLSGDAEELKSLGAEVVFRCRHIYTLLGILNREMLRRPHIRS